MTAARLHCYFRAMQAGGALYIRGAPPHTLDKGLRPPCPISCPLSAYALLSSILTCDAFRRLIFTCAVNTRAPVAQSCTTRRTRYVHPATSITRAFAVPQNGVKILPVCKKNYIYRDLSAIWDIAFYDLYARFVYVQPF